MTHSMTIGEYERGGSLRYERLASTVASILDFAILRDPELHCQPAEHRAKTVDSLRKKLRARGIAEGADLALSVKDLAGCRLVFYSNTDVGRFRSSRIIRDNFDVDWRRTRIHYPGADHSLPDNQFIGDNYVVRLKADRTNLPEYSDLEGLWCELQVQTILNHSWSAMAHDTIYKRPDFGGVGERQMRGIVERMTKIMREYLLPAGYEFQKVLSDFDRLASGQRLLENNILDALVGSPDNNERFELIEKFDSEVLPLYDGIDEFYPEIRRELLRAASIARTLPQTPLETSWGAYPGRTANAVVSRIVRVLLRLRYVDIERTFDALAELYLGADDEGRAALIKAAEQLAKHDLEIWQKQGPIVQAMLADKADGLDPTYKALVRPLLTKVYEQILLPEVTGTSSTSSTVTISSGGVSPSEVLEKLRLRALTALFEQYQTASNHAERREIVAALIAATRFPLHGNEGALRLIILRDSTRVVRFLTDHVDAEDLATRLKIERDVSHLHWREPPGEDASSELRSAVEDLNQAVADFRSTVSASEEYVRFKTLVGWDSIFDLSWERSDGGWKEKEEYRLAEVQRFARELRPDTQESWLALLAACATVDASIGTPFVSRFLELVGETQPEIAELWLPPASTKPLSAFLPALLHGLAKSRAHVVADFLSSSVADGRLAHEALTYMSGAQALDVELLRGATRAALASRESFAIGQALETILRRTKDIGSETARALFLEIVAYLQADQIFRWPLVMSIWWNKEGLFEHLTDDDLRSVLRALVRVPEVDWHVEGMLVEMVKRVPQDVIAFFGSRFEWEQSLGDAPARRSYDAIPHKLERLAGNLLASEVIARAASWSRPDGFRRFRGAAFVAKLFPELTPAVEVALWEFFQAGNKDDQEFVLDVLSNFEGSPVIHNLLRDIVAVLPEESDLLGNANLALHESGVMHGEFGFANDYRAKREALSVWLNDEREQVRKFAEGVLREFENAAASEQRRAEEDVALRRLSYGESPISPRKDSAS